MTTHLTYLTGDLFTSTQPVLGHGVNTHGVMTSGIAPIFCKHFPQIVEPYQNACNQNILLPGNTQFVKVFNKNFPHTKYVFNLTSQELPGANAQLDYFEEALKNSYKIMRLLKLSGFAIPRIGAGVGGLKWEEVNLIIEAEANRNQDINLEVWTLP